MKTHKYLYQKLLDETLIKRAYFKLRKGKTKREEIQYIDAHLDEEIQKMRIMLENTKPIPVEHPELAFNPRKHEVKIRKEHGKERRIYMPDIYEQWVHHIVIAVLSPIILSTSFTYVCGSYPGKGAHFGKRRIERLLHKYRRAKLYYAKMDIRHFYDSIRYKVLFRELRDHIQDEWFLYVIEVCLKHFHKGLPLGYYISQWLANYLLEPMDKMITKEFEAYVRYADDIVIFDGSVDRLKDIVNRIGSMLTIRFHLKLKNNFQVTLFDWKGTGRPLDFMGFQFYRNKTTIRKSIMLSATKLASKVGRKLEHGYRIYLKWISALISYLGWFKHTDSYTCYLYWIKPHIRIGKLKQILSIIERRRNDDGMERNKILTAA